MSWFRPSDPGYGAGLPIRWQGWAVLLTYTGLSGLAAWLFHDRLYLFVPILFSLTTIVVLIARAKTEGGWKWRNSRMEK